jgi:hypothetical protein
MRIPKRGLEKFVREVANECLISQVDRINRGAYFKNYALFGSDQPDTPAMYNKTYAYLDDLQSLLYSPVGLRFQVGDPALPNLLQRAKGQAAAQRLRTLARRSETDTRISDAAFWSLVKGKTFIKQEWRGGGFSPRLIQPEAMGVMHENHDKLDNNMEAFVHTMLITPYQLTRLIMQHTNDDRDRASMLDKAKRHANTSRRGLSPADGAMKQVIVGGLYPFQPAGSNSPNNTRGIVDWMGGPNPTMSPKVVANFIQLDEVWIWDDERSDWATFQIVGDNLLIWPRTFVANALSYNPASPPNPFEPLVGKHPFIEFCPNRTDGYFWGMSEIVLICLLQEAINSRINGINRLMRIQEDPPKHFKMSNGVNQVAVSRFNKPGGYWSDSNPNASITPMKPELPEAIFGSLHEFERMFDEMGGLPPLAKGHGEAGVRSAGHAETLVRMFSPRFKDRALLIERSVEAVGGLMLDLGKAHVAEKLVAWVAEPAAGIEATEPNPLIQPPFEGAVAVPFLFADLDDDMTLMVDSHSSSPAFSAEAKALAFDLLKIGAMGPEDVVQHVDISDPESLEAGIMRRRVAAAHAAQEEQKLKLIHGGGRK